MLTYPLRRARNKTFFTQVYRYWIKKFAEQNYRYEQSRKSERPMWPFVAVMEDNCATWTMTKCAPDNQKVR